MAYRVTNILTTTTSNTYASAAEWIDEHGHCGTINPLCTSGSITLASPTSVRTVKVFESEDDHAEMRAERLADAPKNYTISDSMKETI